MPDILSLQSSLVGRLVPFYVCVCVCAIIYTMMDAMVNTMVDAVVDTKVDAMVDALVITMVDAVVKHIYVLTSFRHSWRLFNENCPFACTSECQ